VTSYRLTTILAAVTVCTVSACNTQPNAADARADLRNRVQLSDRLLEIADDASSVTANTVTRAILNHDSPAHIASLERTRSGVLATVRSMALTPNPETGIVRLYVWSRLATWTCGNRVAAAPDMVVDICDEVFGMLAIRIDAVADTVLDAKTRAHLDTVVDHYKLAHPDLLTVELRRIDDVTGPSDQAVLQASEPTMMSPVTDAARQLEHTRLLGNQLVWLISRMPSALGEQTEGTARVLLESDRVQQAFTHLEALASHTSATAHGLESVAHAQTLLAEHLQALDESTKHTASATENIIRNTLIGIAAIAIGTVLASVAGAMFVIRRVQRTPREGTP